MLPFIADALIGNKSAEKASRAQQQSADAAIAEQRAAREQMRGDLSPFREAGQQGINPLIDAILRPQAPTNDPLFKSLFDNATRTITASNASRGKLHSGDTLQDLTNASLGLGADIQNQRVNQLFNLVSMGQNSAAGSGTATMNAANNISDLLTQKGNARGAELLTKGNNYRGILQQGLNMAGMMGGGI